MCIIATLLNPDISSDSTEAFVWIQPNLSKLFVWSWSQQVFCLVKVSISTTLNDERNYVAPVLKNMRTRLLSTVWPLQICNIYPNPLFLISKYKTTTKIGRWITIIATSENLFHEKSTILTTKISDYQSTKPSFLEQQILTQNYFIECKYKRPTKGSSWWLWYAMNLLWLKSLLSLICLSLLSENESAIN
jgi:hypothetical protein